MKRVLNVAVAAVAALSLAGAELAICCSAHRTACENVKPGDGHAYEIAPDRHCSRPDSATLSGSCCSDDPGGFAGVVLTSPPASGVPAHSSASAPALALALASAPPPIPAVPRTPAHRSPILRL